MAVLEKIRTQGKFTVESGDTSDAIEFFDDISIVLVTVSFPEGTGTAKIQTSNSLHDDLVAGTGVWVDWPNGSITETTQDWCYAPNALRIVNESTESDETVLVEIRGNYSK